MRRWLRIALAITVTLGVTACVPPVAGSVGISVDAQGHPVAVLAWCDGTTPEEVIVSHEETSSGVSGTDSESSPSSLPSDTAPTRWVEDATFHAPDLDGQSASVRLDAPAGGWTVEPGPPALKPGVMYHVSGGKGRGNSRVNTSSVSFTTEDLVKLEPGRVFVQKLDETSPTITWVDTTISRAEFDREGQDPDACQ
ncbi:hypothetical protein [Planomonospora sphaerica]|uniref:hypothetical protein n=1 Tax=Planomonospora sphaerica TaxID=161355 RepID=UPI00129035D3|nr:hypothetical protein [Planomonospora sphaerica]